MHHKLLFQNQQWNFQEMRMISILNFFDYILHY